MSQTKIITTNEVSTWVSEVAGYSFETIIYLGGDRIFCCDEAVAIMDELDNILGVATIAPQGEMRSGQPTIVGVYVLPSMQGQGLGAQLFEATVRRCLERGFESIQVDAMSTAMVKVIDKMDAEHRAHLIVNDHS